MEDCEIAAGGSIAGVASSPRTSGVAPGKFPRGLEKEKAMSEGREQVLGRVREALGRRSGGDARRPIAAQPVSEKVVRQVERSSPDELWDRFQSRLDSLGDSARRFADIEQVRQWLVSEIKKRGFRAGAMDHEAADLLGVSNGKLEGTEIVSPGKREEMLRAEFGVTLADFAVAETGTIAVSSGPERSLMTSLTPQVHFAIVRLESLVADVYDGMEKIAATPKKNFVWITGSSRTADIEGIL
ncbi:MAG: LUD domain-containing protein, partial [bacterium]